MHHKRQALQRPSLTPLRLIFALFLGGIFIGFTDAQSAPNLQLGVAAPAPRPRKKVVYFGNDAPTPVFARDHVQQIEARPFDGVVIRLPKYQHIFDTTAWKEADLAPDREAMAATKWQRFTDNFLFLNGTNFKAMDWFDEKQWDVILLNMKLFSRLIRDGRFKGLCFDAEPYGQKKEGADVNPWFYPGKYPVEKQAQLPAQVRLRGRQLMSALQTDAPAVRILNFHMMARLLYQMGPNDQRWIDWKTPPDVAGQTPFHHQGHKYALMGDFLMGMLDAANPSASFVDGNEHAYYYTNHEEFQRARTLIRQGARSLVPAALWPKYSQQVQVGSTVFPNWVLGDWPHETQGYVPPDFLSPWEQLRYLESQMYNALSSTDEYVWLYTEHMEFFRPPANSGRGKVPDGLEAALVSARRKYESGQALGYDVGPLVRSARDRLIRDGKPQRSESEAKAGD